ncbi:MAG: cysteine desulfurase [Maricaulaceae bacterium]|jgi:cysteine desulfurase/selenocysteine lyase
MNAPAFKPKAAFDADALRAQFPIFARQVNGRPLVYLDSAASAQKPRAVIDAMTAVMETSYANVHRGLHTLANEATEAFEAARGKTAAFLNAQSADNIVFTRGSTEAINLVASSFAELISEGDEIVLSEMEHHSNIIPWHFLRERRGAVLKWVPVHDDGSLDMEAYAAALGARTRIVAVTHMSNVLGTITDVAEITRLAHAAGAAVLLDGSQAAVHLPRVDVQAIGCDFYVFTGHKLYGPTGAGSLYAAGDWLDRLRPYQGGGEMIETVSKKAVVYNAPPHKFEAGTPAIIEAIGLGAAIDFIVAIDREAAAAHEAMLAQKLADGLRAWNDVRILGEADGKGAIVSFQTSAAHAHDIAQILDKTGVAVRAGHHCAEPLMRRFGVTSTARASFAIYNTEDDVERCLEGFAKARELLA